jgi:hypothetical protein
MSLPIQAAHEYLSGGTPLDGPHRLKKIFME